MQYNFVSRRSRDVHRQRAERQVDDGGLKRMAARKAHGHDFAQVRHDVGTRTLERAASARR